MPEFLIKIKDILHALFTESYLPDDEILNRILFRYVYCALSVLAIAGLILLIALNPDIRKRKGAGGKIAFFESAVLLVLIASQMIISFTQHLYYFLPIAISVTYMLVVMMWLIYVDHCMYRSVELIKRRYKHATLPVIIYALTDIVVTAISYALLETDLLINYSGDVVKLVNTLINITYAMDYVALFIHVCYILTATYVVRKHDKTFREPRFIKLGVFVIPFVIGAVLKPYNGAFMALGLILTCLAAKKRESYIERETGFYNRDYLGFVSEYHDKKAYLGADGIIIDAAGHGEDMAELLKETMADDIMVFNLAKEKFLILGEPLRGSAKKMAADTLIEAASNSEEPYTPNIVNISRSADETAKDFAARLLREPIR